MMFSSKFIRWLKFSILLFCIILILMGFAFGYIYNNYISDNCIGRPLSYGIEKLNDMNDAEFTCTCTGSSDSKFIEPFSFNKNGLIKNNIININDDVFNIK